ncbi:MAG: hypothetical protein H7Z43_12005 [Clostridia bacterium]|nr:hypothetical protein [Deltaproteobacteria bacterium]
MHELFAEEIADNDRVLRSFSAVVGGPPSQLSGPVVPEEVLGHHDWSIVTSDPAGPAAQARRDIIAKRAAGENRSDGAELLSPPEPTRFDVQISDDDEREETRIMDNGPMSPALMSNLESTTKSRPPGRHLAVHTRQSRVVPKAALSAPASKKSVWASIGFVLALGVLVVTAVLLARKGPPPLPAPALPVIAEPPQPEARPPVDPEPAPEKDPNKNEVKFGFLSVRTKDGRPARVYIDRREVGPAPIVRRRVSLGSHSVRIVDRTNFAKSLDIKVNEGHTKKHPLDVAVGP